MKKSEMTVTMPLTSFNEYEKYLKEYEDLRKELADCLSSQLYEAGGSQSIDFDAKKALDICKRFVSYKYEGVDVEIKV